MERKSLRVALDRYTVGAEVHVVRGSAESWPVVYDLIANRRSMKISRAHAQDVNSVCWADTASGNVLISGSDDGFIKVW
jgi:WD repeat-containing protein 23